MKSTAIVCAIAAASMGFGSLSYAQTWDRGDRDGRRYEHRGQRTQQPQHHVQPQQYSRHGQINQYSQYNHYGNAQHHQWSGHARQYYRGDHLPYQFRQHQYYVNDWRAHRLYAPPYGYQWVQSDSGDFLLVALATGLIANLLLNQ